MPRGSASPLNTKQRAAYVGREEEKVKNEKPGSKVNSVLIKRWIVLIIYSCIILFTLSIVRAIRDATVESLGPRGFAWIISSMFALCGIYLAIWLIRKKIYRSPIRLLIILCTTGVYIFFILQLELAVERLHYIEYGIAALLALRVFMLSHRNAAAILLALIYVLDLGLVDEFIQWILPMRVGEFRDVGINLTAGIFALIPALACSVESSLFRVPNRKSIAVVLLHGTATLLFWGVFITFVHGFGHEITIESGTRFKSVFAETVFADVSRTPGSVAWQDASRSPRAHRSERGFFRWIDESIRQWRAYRHPTPEAYNYEAWRHARHRDGLSNERYRKYHEAREEEVILRRYYKPYIDSFNLMMADSTFERYAKIPPKEPVPYISPVQELLVTTVSRSQFWIVVAICLIFMGIPGILLHRIRQ